MRLYTLLAAGLVGVCGVLATTAHAQFVQVSPCTFIPPQNTCTASEEPQVFVSPPGAAAFVCLTGNNYPACTIANNRDSSITVTFNPDHAAVARRARRSIHQPKTDQRR